MKLSMELKITDIEVTDNGLLIKQAVVMENGKEVRKAELNEALAAMLKAVVLDFANYLKLKKAAKANQAVMVLVKTFELVTK